MKQKTVTLASGTEMPLLGFGTYELHGTVAEEAVGHALEVGFRHIDTADRYKNHKEVGQAIAESSLHRDEVFLTTKIMRDDLHRQDVLNIGKRFLEELQTDYIDLLLVHWPNRDIPIQETLEAFQKLQEGEVTRAIGVSNFTIPHLEAALQTGITIEVNQVEYRPSFQQEALKAFCDEHNIVLTAYSPLGQGADLKLPVVTEIAEESGMSPAQVIIVWLLQQGIAAIPRSDKLEHITDNIKALDLSLTPQQMERMAGITPKDVRLIHPEFAEF